jgi:hypothetical protein
MKKGVTKKALPKKNQVRSKLAQDPGDPVPAPGVVITELITFTRPQKEFDTDSNGSVILRSVMYDGFPCIQVQVTGVGETVNSYGYYVGDGNLSFITRDGDQTIGYLIPSFQSGIGNSRAKEILDGLTVTVLVKKKVNPRS